MKAAKLLEILTDLKAEFSENLWSIDLTCSGGGELLLSFSGQPEMKVHRYLKKRGFVPYVLFSENPGAYVYRPR